MKRESLLIFQLVLASVSLALASQPSSSGSCDNRLVRLALHKETTMDAGIAGQPFTSYYVNMDIGTPGKPYKMLVDLNTKETWLPHDLTFPLASLVCKRLHYNKGYSKKASSTSSKESTDFQIEYNTCELTGKAYEDFMVVQNLTECNGQQPVSVRQRFLAISSASNGAISEYPTDGVLALSPALMSDTGSRNFLVNMEQNCLINELKFSLYLDSDLRNTDGGELALGGVGPTKFIGNFYYHSLSNLHDRWELRIQSVMLGGQTISSSRLGSVATLSTGVNELYGPVEEVDLIMNFLGVSKGARKVDEEVNHYEIYEIDCLRVAELPPITINIDGVAYRIPPSMYVKKRIQGLIFKDSSCYLTIFSNKDNNGWILGTNFLANFYTTFDMNRRQVGFAAKRI